MGRAAGLGLRGLSTFLYALEFACAGVIVGIFAYFLKRLSFNNLFINRRWEAIVGMSALAVIYTAFAVIFTCFIGGITFFALVAILMNLLFVGAFIAIAYFTRAGAYSCSSGIVNTPLGSNTAGYGLNAPATYTPNIHRACILNKVCFALAVALACLFLLSALLQLFVWLNHRKEKRYGPSPDNDYTSGSGRFRRKRDIETEKVVEPVEPIIVPEPISYVPDRTHNIRPSADTGYTDTTAVAAVDTYAPLPKNEVMPEELPSNNHHHNHVEHVVPVIPVGLDSEQTGNVTAPGASQYGNFRGLTPGQIAVGPTGHLPVEDGPLDHGALRGGAEQYSASRANNYSGNNYSGNNYSGNNYSGNNY